MSSVYMMLHRNVPRWTADSPNLKHSRSNRSNLPMQPDSPIGWRDAFVSYWSPHHLTTRQSRAILRWFLRGYLFLDHLARLLEAVPSTQTSPSIMTDSRQHQMLYKDRRQHFLVSRVQLQQRSLESPSPYHLVQHQARDRKSMEIEHHPGLRNPNWYYLTTDHKQATPSQSHIRACMRCSAHPTLSVNYPCPHF